MTLRQAAKAAIERVLRHTLANPRRMAGRSLVLAYHNVVPDAEAGRGDRSLHIPLSRFATHLDLIAAHCRVLPLEEVLAGPPPAGVPTVAITFDDAYKGAVELGLPELARRRLPGTLFVAPGLLGQRSFWWDEQGEHPGGLSEEVRKRALDQHMGKDTVIRAALPPAPSAGRLPTSYGCATADQVTHMARSGRVTLGAHSWSHPNLASLDPEALSDEMSRPLAWLRATTVPMVSFVAYPYGLASPAVEVAAEEAGYAAGLLVEGGWLHRKGSPWQIPRLNVPAGLSEAGLMLRLAGVLDAPPRLAGR